MTETTLHNGRLGNQIIRNIAVHFIAQKHDLAVRYANDNLIKSLGINLFSGKNDFGVTYVMNDDNFFDILNAPQINFNIDANNNFFQTNAISNMIYKWVNSEMKNNIINNNPFKERYSNNEDIFLHIRLTDAAGWSPGYEYYQAAIDSVSCNKIFISTDDINHELVQLLVKNNHNVELFIKNEIETIQFGSTCKNIILSHGSFSAIIGWLSFYSNVYYCKYNPRKIWYGDMFSIDGWHELSY